jgi:hypothetical protein
MNSAIYRNPVRSLLIRLALVGAAASLIDHAKSGTVTYVGSETSTGSSYPVHDWSNTSVAKNHDTNGNDAYGSAGYWQIRPMPGDPGAANIFDAAGPGNDLGTSAGSDPTLFSAPSFLASISGGAGTHVNFGGYPTFRGPDGSALYRQGALSVPLNQGPFNSPAGENSSHVGVPVQFTLGSASRFRLGLVVDAVADGTYAPHYVSVFHLNTGTVFSPALTRDGNPDMVFFDITGDVGDSFIVGLWQNVGSQSVAPLSLVTFDPLPDSDPPVLSHTIQDGNFILSWPAETSGWTLESSTDLGGVDGWDPVPGVVNNSVSVPMTAPANFFRLRKDP